MLSLAFLLPSDRGADEVDSLIMLCLVIEMGVLPKVLEIALSVRVACGCDVRKKRTSPGAKQRAPGL